MGYRPALLVTLALAVTTACGTYDRRLDPDAPDPVGGAVLRTQDINAMADQMARSIVEEGVLRSSSADQRISFYITRLRNDSSDVIDTELALYEIRTKLAEHIGRRVKILDRSQEGLEEIRNERAAKRSGAVTSNPDMSGGVAGADYALKGVIKDRVLQSGSLKSVGYYVYFEIVDLETGELVWSRSYQAKFGSEKSVISR